MTIKAVIFDLDGTITQPFLDFGLIREKMGLDESEGPLLEAMEKMTAARRKDAERILYRYEQEAVDESILNAGTKETLCQLREWGINVGILTRNRAENAVAVCEKHGLEFDVVIGREDGPVKPDAFGVLHICERFSVAPQRTLMVGDYLYDLLCAKAAGAIAVLLKNNHSAEEFIRHADFTIANIPEILQIIEDRNEIDL